MSEPPALPPLPDVELVSIKQLDYRNRLIPPSDAEIGQMAAILEHDGAMLNPILCYRQTGIMGRSDGMMWPDLEALIVIDGATHCCCSIARSEGTKSSRNSILNCQRGTGCGRQSAPAGQSQSSAPDEAEFVGCNQTI